MAVPTVAVRVDWGGATGPGAFTQAIDDVTSRVLAEGLSWTRGRSADFSAEATGAASFTLQNDDDRFTPDRNWCDNPSFEAGTAGWSIAASPVTVVATSITQVTDKYGEGGTKAGEAVLTATQYSGVTYPIPYPFRSGVNYAVRVWLKSMSGNLNVDCGIGSLADADWGSSTGAITTSWASKSVPWTPSGNRAGATLWIRTTTAAAATLRIDAIQINPGATANTYIEAPTKGQLVPGKPVHIMATYSATDYGCFYGFIERLAPDPRGRTMAVTCYDVFRRMGERPVVVPPATYWRWNRDVRLEALEDFERGTLNLVSNPEFATDTTGWGHNGTSFTRVTGETGLPVGVTTAGEFISTTSAQLLYHDVRMSPVIPVGVTYRLSAYLRVPSGASLWNLTMTQAKSATQERTKLVLLSTAWQRVTITLTTNETTTASANVFRMSVTAIEAGGGTVRIGAVSLTRGPEAHPYSAVGVGRYPNWCGNVGTPYADGWYPAYANGCLNPSLESDASGWTGTTDWGASLGITLARSTTYAYTGSASLLATSAGGDYVHGAKYEMTGTYKAGITYLATAHVRTSAGSYAVSLRVGDYGSADIAAQAITATTAWQRVTVVWTPSADRTSAAIGFTVAGDHVSYWDGFCVVPQSAGLWSLTGPGGGGWPAGSASVSGAVAKYGPYSVEAVTGAVATSGLYYDYALLGSYFVAGKTYTASVWLYCSTSFPYKVAFGGNAADGTWDEASATGTASAATWTRVSVTWTPAADHAGTTGNCGLFIYQTDATARTFYVDGMRTVPGASADDFQMAHWLLGTEEDVWVQTAAFSGSALSVLEQINALSLTRHWVSPESASPWYSYNTCGRADLAAKTSAETYNDDLADMSAAEIDRDQIVNTVALTHLTGTEYYSDEASVAMYGERPGPSIGGTSVWSSASPYPDAIGPALAARYKDPRARPRITVVNRFPSQLQRELDDLVTVNFARLGITGGKYLVAAMTTTISQNGNWWETVYTLEESP